MKDIAPSTQLRRCYGHRLERFTEFRRRYLIELRDAQPAATVDRLRELARTRPVMLLTATRDVDHSQAAVLSNLLRDTVKAAHPAPCARPVNAGCPRHTDSQEARA